MSIISLTTPGATNKPGASITVSGVSKTYGSTTVLDNLDLEIRGGEFLTLLGASGSGKSTLLNIISGFIKPTAGTIEVGGRLLNKVPPHKRGFGVVFQNYSLFPHMSIADNVAFPLRRHGWSKAEIKRGVAEALALVELGHLGARMPSELSGGQQQRVALARAIVFKPPVLLMDEPLGALDKLLREQLQLEIRRLHQELGITFVFVTHDQDEALAMSDRIALLRNGSIVQVGSPEELYKRPNCRYAAEFIGASNIFSGFVDTAGFAEPGTEHRFRLAVEVPRGETNVMLRPERISVIGTGQTIPVGHDRIDGIVEDNVYFGNCRQVQVRTADGRLVIARTPVPHTADAVVPGAPVHMHWNVEDLTVLDV
ncbi:ABC transporter ATP-binding protein [Rhodococcus sp. IEGM 1366]|uniref:ABC transporter ATP-binding protein n=1 Tax=Rhodococcus sp. IEGM 1366 TaxID=3082223 RepID=UPI0029553854|nr:ABC transporter ATP-binding protein [Rhodococcus sp. IEGM 1366]MDV8070705.1 ABC transporter ATP-binding protein [Rhodococcus sp. IEGM 1366]